MTSLLRYVTWMFSDTILWPNVVEIYILDGGLSGHVALLEVSFRGHGKD